MFILLLLLFYLVRKYNKEEEIILNSYTYIQVLLSRFVHISYKKFQELWLPLRLLKG